MIKHLTQPFMRSYVPEVKRVLKGGMRTDHLWMVALLLAAVIPLSVAPVHPHDFWWHLKIGELIYTQGSIPDTQIFSWTLNANTPYVYGAWLAELIFYVLFRIGGLSLVIFLRNMLAFIAYGLVGYEAQLRTASWRFAALAILFVHILNLATLTLRPQVFSWLFFPLFLILLGKYVDGQLHRYWLLVCPILMALWVNLHGAFILGLVLLGIYFTGTLISRFLNQADAVPWSRIRWLGFAGLLTFLSILANPRFIGIFSYVADLMSDPPSQQLVTEWQSPTLAGFTNNFFYFSILLIIVCLAYSSRRLKSTDVLLTIAFLWLAWNGKRYLIWYGMAVMPILVELISGLKFARSLRRKRNWFNVVFLALLSGALIVVQPWSIERLPLPNILSDRIQLDSNVGPLVSVKTPVEAVEYIKEHPGGKLFNDMGYGSYLIWAMPEQKVFIDTRVELYPFDQWMDYLYIISGMRYNELLSKYGVNRLLIDKQSQSELLYMLEDDPKWVKEYEDSYAQIWRRNHQTSYFWKYQ